MACLTSVDCDYGTKWKKATKDEILSKHPEELVFWGHADEIEQKLRERYPVQGRYADHEDVTRVVINPMYPCASTEEVEAIVVPEDSRIYMGRDPEEAARLLEEDPNTQLHNYYFMAKQLMEKGYVHGTGHSQEQRLYPVPEHNPEEAKRKLSQMQRARYRPRYPVDLRWTVDSAAFGLESTIRTEIGHDNHIYYRHTYCGSSWSQKLRRLLSAIALFECVFGPNSWKRHPQVIRLREDWKKHSKRTKKNIRKSRYYLALEGSREIMEAAISKIDELAKQRKPKPRKKWRARVKHSYSEFSH